VPYPHLDRVIFILFMQVSTIGLQSMRALVQNSILRILSLLIREKMLMRKISLDRCQCFETTAVIIKKSERNPSRA
jgi:hypothetical protein